MTKQEYVNFLVLFSLLFSSCGLIKKTNTEKYIYKHDTIFIDTSKTLFFNLQKTLSSINNKEAIISLKDTIIKIDTLYFKINKTDIIYKENTQKSDTVFILSYKKDNFIKKQSETINKTEKSKYFKLSNELIYFLIILTLIILYFVKNGFK